MFWLKGCPKCGGDLYKQTDQFGTYVACLQCGRHVIPDPVIGGLTPLSELVDGPALTDSVPGVVEEAIV